VQFFKSPFEKLTNSQQERIANAVELTSLQVSPGGDLFGVFIQIRDYLKIISEKKEVGNKVKIKGRDAAAVAKGVTGIGQGMKLIVEALNAMGDAKDAKQKMDVITGGIDAIKDMGMAILIFAGTLALALPLLIIGIPGLMLSVLMITIVGGMFWMLGKMGITKEIKEVATGLAIAGLAIVSLAAGFVLAEIILSYAGAPFTTLAMVGSLVLGTALVFGIAGIFGGLIRQGAMAMLFATLPILAISLSMLVFTAAIKPDADGWESIAQIGATVTGLGLVMAGAGAAAAFIIPGAGAMVMSGLALLLISFGISAMQNALSPKMFAPGGIFADSGNATEPVEVLGITIMKGGRPMSNMEWALLSIARSFMLPPLAIAGMYAGAPALIMSGIALLSIAKGIEKFQALDINYETLPDGIAKVTTVLATAFGEIGAKYPGGGPSISSVLMGDYSGTSSVYQGIKAVSGMGRALSGIAQGVQYMAMLKFPTKWDKNGNPVEFRSITTDDLAMVGVNTRNIVLALSKTFSEVGQSEAAQGSTWFTSSDYEKGINVVKKMGDPLIKLTEFVKTFNDIKEEEVRAVGNKTQLLIKTLTSSFFANSTELKPNDYFLISMAYQRMADANEDIADSFEDWKESINDLDLKKVTEVRKLYEGLAYLSKNGGETAIEQMGESMVEAIEMLVEKLDEFAQNIGGNNNPGIIERAGNALGLGRSTANAENTTAAAPVANNAELAEAIKRLERALSGTLPVYVTNQNI